MEENLNNYYFIDYNNKLIDIFVFDESTCRDEDIENIKLLIDAALVIRNDNGKEVNLSIQSIKIAGSAVHGYEWDGVDTFLPPKPGDNYILNPSRTGWILIPQNNIEVEVM